MTKQSGNMLFILLIAIALLGALAAILTRSSNTSDDTGSSEQTSIQASNILKYAASVEMATQALITRGCSESQLNFAHSTNDNPVNPGAAPNNACDIYHVAGAGMTYKKVPTSALAVTALYNTHWHTERGRCIVGVGTGTTTCNPSEMELRLVIGGLKKEVCDEINRRVGIVTTTTPSDSDSFNQFAGTFPAHAESLTNKLIGDIGTSTILQGKKSGCLMDTDGTGNGWYDFYHVLIAR